MVRTPARVLVAEASAAVRAICVHALRDAGFDVHEAPSRSPWMRRI